MTRTIQRTLYTFSELSEKAQAKAIDWYRSNKEYDYTGEIEARDSDRYISDCLTDYEYEFYVDGSFYNGL
jgi:hypothetical protein